MTVEDVEKVRAVSKAANSGPWVGWWDQMAKKTVIRRLAKVLPQSSDLDDFLRRGDEPDFADHIAGAVALPARPTRGKLVHVPAADGGSTEKEPATDAVKNAAPDKEEAGPVLYQFVTWEGEIEEDLHSGTFCDHIEAAFKDARDIPALEAAWENNADAIAALLTDPDGQQTKAWHKSLQDAFAARIVALTPAEETEPLVNAKGAVALFGADGLVVNRYQRVMPWFDNLKQHVAKAKDRSAVIDANAAGAEHWVAQKAANAAAFWAEIQKMGATEKV
jgi:hypothetical protein